MGLVHCVEWGDVEWGEWGEVMWNHFIFFVGEHPLQFSAHVRLPCNMIVEATLVRTMLCGTRGM